MSSSSNKRDKKNGGRHSNGSRFDAPPAPAGGETASLRRHQRSDAGSRCTGRRPRHSTDIGRRRPRQQTDHHRHHHYQYEHHHLHHGDYHHGNHRHRHYNDKHSLLTFAYRMLILTSTLTVAIAAAQFQQQEQQQQQLPRLGFSRLEVEHHNRSLFLRIETNSNNSSSGSSSSRPAFGVDIGAIRPFWPELKKIAVSTTAAGTSTTTMPSYSTPIAITSETTTATPTFTNNSSRSSSISSSSSGGAGSAGSHSTNSGSTRLPGLDAVVSGVRSRPEIASAERPSRWRAQLLQRGGRQAPTVMHPPPPPPSTSSSPSSSSSRIVHSHMDTMMRDAAYPLTSFGEVDFDESDIGPINLNGDVDIDDSEMHRRRGLHASTTSSPASTDEAEPEAAFSGALETNLTASLGQTAFLRCRLKNPQHQVTWIRIRDWHILTSGLLTYTADARFRVKHATEASEWTLEIKFLQKRDEGTYYCQIPTKTGAVVHAFHLHVASPQAVILGGQVSHVDILTPSLTLVCIVDNTPDPPQVIFWYHNGTLLKDGKYPETGDPSAGSGLISSHLTLTPSRTMSMLTLQHIQHIHSGNYTCRAPNAEPDTTQLFVTQRHEQAAVHRSSSARRSAAPPSSIVLMVAAALVGHVLTIRRKDRHHLLMTTER